MKNTEEIPVTEVTEVTEEVIARPYALRPLKDRDLFPILDILGVVLPDDLATVLLKVATKEKKVTEIGAVVIVRLVKAICKNMGKVKNDLYTLLSDVSGIPAEELAEMPFGTTPMMIWDIVNNEKNNGFFKVLSKLS